MFDFNIDILTLSFLGAAFVMAVIAVAYCLAPWRKAAQSEPVEDEEISDGGELPMISVVVYAEGDEEETMECVRQILAQNCERFEIIVVCRTSMESRNILAARLAEHPNVYVTFIPTGSHNLSERKLAITIGLKAAKGDVVLTTASNIRIPSPDWLSEMRAPFADSSVELVLGYSHIDFKEMTGPRRWYRQFDALLESAQWIAAARNGHPYRGDGFNLAFRRDTFFAHKGYAKSMYLHYGDDDLFVHELANASNTRIVVNKPAILTTTWSGMANKMWLLRKERYQFTARWLPKAPFLKIGLLSALQWLILGCAAAAIVLGLPSLIPTIIAVTIVLAFDGFQIATYRRMASALEATRLWFAVPLFLLLHPVLNAIFRMSHHGSAKGFYTWRR